MWFHEGKRPPDGIGSNTDRNGVVVFSIIIIIIIIPSLGNV